MSQPLSFAAKEKSSLAPVSPAKHLFDIFVKSMAGGAAIALGGTIYLSLDNHVAGSFLFALGLFSIYTFGFSLYTGKVCYIPNKKPAYLGEVFWVFAGNVAGTVGYAALLGPTRLSKLIPTAQALVEHKLSDGLYSTFVMGILCGLMMCVAVLGFQTITDSVGKHLALVMPIMVFILSGFEHSIADLFYYSLAGAWSAHAILYIAVIALGNLIGGALIPVVARVTDGKKLGC